MFSYPPADESFTHLKQQLISGLCASEQKRIRQLQSEEQLGDRIPYQFLQHLQQLQGSNTVESTLLQELLRYTCHLKCAWFWLPHQTCPLSGRHSVPTTSRRSPQHPVSTVHVSTAPKPPASDALTELRADVCA